MHTLNLVKSPNRWVYQFAVHRVSRMFGRLIRLSLMVLYSVKKSLISLGSFTRKSSRLYSSGCMQPQVIAGRFWNSVGIRLTLGMLPPFIMLNRPSQAENPRLSVALIVAEMYSEVSVFSP